MLCQNSVGEIAVFIGRLETVFDKIILLSLISLFSLGCWGYEYYPPPDMSILEISGAPEPYYPPCPKPDPEPWPDHWGWSESTTINLDSITTNGVVSLNYLNVVAISLNIETVPRFFVVTENEMITIYPKDGWFNTLYYPPSECEVAILKCEYMNHLFELSRKVVTCNKR